MNTKRLAPAEEYEIIKKSEIVADFIAKNVIPKIPEKIRPFFRLKYCRGTKIGEKTLEPLIEAILVFSSHVNVSQVCSIFIGTSPFCFDVTPCGSFSYDQKPEFTATTIMNHNIIFLDFHILSRLSFEICVASILEELVHAFFDVEEHPLTNNIVALLYPNVIIDDRGEYQVRTPHTP